MGSRPAPKALPWVGSYPVPKALPRVSLCPAPRSESTALGGLMPRTEHAVLGGLPLTSTIFHDFRAHEPRMRIDGLSASTGNSSLVFLASVAAAKGGTGRGSISPAADTVFASFLPYPSRAARAPQQPKLQRRPSRSRVLYHGVLRRRRTLPRPTVRPRPSLPCLALQPLRRQQRADKQQQLPVMHPRCSTGSVSSLLGAPAPPSATTRQRTATATGSAPPL